MLKEIINENGHPQMVDDESDEYREANQGAENTQGENERDGGVSELAALATATPEQSDFLKGTPSEFNGGQSSDPTPDISVLTAEIATLMTRIKMLENIVEHTRDHLNTVKKTVEQNSSDNIAAAIVRKIIGYAQLAIDTVKGKL